MLSRMSKKKAGFYIFDGTDIQPIKAGAFSLGKQLNYTNILRKGTQTFASNFGVDFGLPQNPYPKKKVNLLDEYFWK